MKGFVAHGAMASYTLKKSEKELEIVLFGGCAHGGVTEMANILIFGRIVNVTEHLLSYLNQSI